MILLSIYYILLVGGLATMLVDGWGWLVFIAYYGWMPLGAMSLWLVTHRDRRSLNLGYYPHLPQHVTLGAIGAAGLAGALFGSMYITGWVDAESTHRNIWSVLFGVAVQQIIVAGLEELAFRGVVQQMLVEKLGLGRGLIAAATLFGLLHLPNIISHEVPPQHVPLTLGTLILMGLVFGWAFHRTGNQLALPVALHFGWNLVCFGLEDSLTLTYSGPWWLIGVPEWFPESGVLGALGLIVLGFWVWRVPRWRTENGLSFRGRD